MLYTYRKQKVTYCQKLILLGLLNIFSLTNVSNSAPLTENQFRSHLKLTDISPPPPPPPPSSSSSSSSSTLLSKKHTLDGGGNPSELAWQAWLLFDNEGGSNTKSISDSTHVRRITPKSIFIAPPLPACPDGYETDSMNRCVKQVKIDQDAHIDFILQRLNAMYANLGKPQLPPQSESSPLSSSSSSSSSSLGKGPLQLNIPLILDTVNDDTSASDNIDIKEPEKTFLTFTSPLDKNTNEKPMVSHDEDTITVYEVKDTKKQQDHEEIDEKIFLIENHNVEVDKNNKSNSAQNEKFVPIVEFVQESNSNITDIVDYNIPVISMSQIQNRTEFINVNYDNYSNKNKNNDGIIDNNKLPNETLISSAVVLLLTSSNSSTPNKYENITSTNNKNNEQVIIEIKNNINKSTIENNTSDNFSDETTTSITPIDVVFNDSESTDGFPDVEITTESSTYKSDIVDDYDETTDYTDEVVDEQDDVTDHTEEDFETSTESDEEILKHSEAGMSITIPGIHIKSSLNTSNKDKNITVSNISSVVIINDDFIRETALLDFNVNEPVNISKDTAIENKMSSINSTNEQNVDVITPKSQIIREITFPSKEIVSIINLNDEKNIESSTIVNDDTSETTANDFQSETKFPSTTQIDEMYLTNSDDINPVVAIEDGLMDGIIDQQSPTSLTETLRITSSIYKNEDQRHINDNVSNRSEIMTASSTNDEKITLSLGERQQASLLTPLMDEPQSTKHIRASTPMTFDNNRKNHLTSALFNDRSVFNYDAISQQYPIHHAYEIHDNRPVIKTMDDQHLESNKNLWHNFFPTNFRPSFDSTSDYVRFPSHKTPNTPSGQVRFPSDEANSIHTLDELKERYNNERYASQSNRELMRAAPLKQSNWHTPPCCRSDHQRTTPQLSTSNTNDPRRDVSSVFMKFWTNVPLIKDHSQYQSTYATVVPVDTARQNNDEQLHSSRTVNFYNGMSLPKPTRIFSKHLEIRD